MNWLRKLFAKNASRSTKEIARFFDQASANEEHFPSTIDPRIYHVRLLLDHLGEVRGQRIADIGCGKGRFARLVAERGASVVAVDLSTVMLAAADADLRRVAASMTELPLANSSCDGAYATESLEHAIDIEKAVAELCRIVRPGGKILIIDKNAEQWGKLETPAWERWFTRRELETQLSRHCTQVSSRFISYWEDVEPDGLFIAWLAVK